MGFLVSFIADRACFSLSDSLSRFVLHTAFMMVDFISALMGFLETPLFTIGTSRISLLKVIILFSAVTLLLVGARSVKRILVNKVLIERIHDQGIRVALGTVLQYLIVFFGFLILFQSAGIDLSSLAVLSGTVGIGIGFGLQNIANNFFSGLIILIERPIKVGDRIQVGDIDGDVVRIAIRSTTILTNDNINIIIPNSEFVSQQVINWSHNDPNLRVTIPVGVAYSSNPSVVQDLLLSVASDHPGILDSPKPDVIFGEFGDSSLNFELRVWTTTYSKVPRVLRSELNYRIYDVFQRNGIEIPFPQRDLHLRSSDVALFATERQTGS